MPGAEWSDDGQPRDHRHLKSRPVGEWRRVPVAPPLTRILRAHLRDFGTASGGRVFTEVQGGELLEDVDVFHSATERDDEGSGVTLSGLLNALDGIATPRGLLTVTTTNDPSALDVAVIRPGRVDLSEQFGYARRARSRAWSATTTGWSSPPRTRTAFPSWRQRR